MAIGPAARWGKVYTNLEKHGLTVAGGRAANVGVGGLVLGGKALLLDFVTEPC